MPGVWTCCLLETVLWISQSLGGILSLFSFSSSTFCEINWLLANIKASTNSQNKLLANRLFPTWDKRIGICHCSSRVGIIPSAPLAWLWPERSAGSTIIERWCRSWSKFDHQKRVTQIFTILHLWMAGQAGIIPHEIREKKTYYISKWQFLRVCEASSQMMFQSEPTEACVSRTTRWQISSRSKPGALTNLLAKKSNWSSELLFSSKSDFPALRMTSFILCARCLNKNSSCRLFIHAPIPWEVVPFVK